MSEKPYQSTQLLSERDNTNDNSKFINLIAREESNVETNFRVKRTTQLKKLIEAYCIRQGKEEMYLRFCYDGERIQVGYAKW
nr:6486_t:CDS:2 [Entrophospora candida]CAG8644272.1 1828_t:CDS:2 [Entrophospora candida]